MKKMLLLLCLAVIALAISSFAQESFGPDPPVALIPTMLASQTNANIEGYSIVNVYYGTSLGSGANTGKVRIRFSFNKGTGTNGNFEVDHICVVPVSHGSLNVAAQPFFASSINGTTFSTSVPYVGTVTDHSADTHYLTTFFTNLFPPTANADLKYPFDLYVAIHFTTSSSNASISTPYFQTPAAGAGTTDFSGYSYGINGTDFCAATFTVGSPLPSSLFFGGTGVDTNPSHLRLVTQLSNN